MKIKCPICGLNEFDEIGDYCICEKCHWENDSWQNDNPNESGGANTLSQNDFRKWWGKINTVIPPLIKKYNIERVQSLVPWEFSGFIASKENMKQFIEEATKSNIELRLSFYNLCKKYKHNDMTFHGFPLIKANTVKENNDEIINILFTEDPIRICEKYDLKQVVKLLKKSKDARKFWNENLPCIDIVSNPEAV